MLLLKTSVTLMPYFFIASVFSAFVARLPVRIVGVTASDIRYYTVYIPYFLQCLLPRATCRLR